MKPGAATTAPLTALALACFAANSVLCRLALGTHAIDAAGFTAVRLASGALLLVALRAASRRDAAPRPDRLSPALLFAYAAAFSFAYLDLPAGTGALLLFGSVQATMLLAALRGGERFRAAEGVGLALALAGLAWLVAPGLAAPSPRGSALMVTAGVAWGLYSIRGRGTADPLTATARNFAWATPLALAVALLAWGRGHASPRGLALAIASGALTSGLGYVTWFAALRGLTAIRAAVVQLAVPALAAMGGVLVLSERLTLRLVVAAVAILGGVAIAIASHRPRRS